MKEKKKDLSLNRPSMSLIRSMKKCSDKWIKKEVKPTDPPLLKCENCSEHQQEEEVCYKCQSLELKKKSS